MKVTGRASRITPFYVMELLEKAQAMEARGEDIVHMEVGEPDFASPKSVKEGAMAAIRDDRTFYTHSLGLPDLRARIAANYKERDGLDISRERIVITNGTSGAFLLLFATLLDRDKTLALSDPGYPCYKNFGVFVDAGILPIPVSEETKYELTESHLRGLKKAPDLVVISNPSNPVGNVYSQEALTGIYRFLSSRDAVLVVDEIYSGLTYGKSPRTALAISNEIIVVNGFSKTYAMTGWRLGWVVVPVSLVRPIQRIAQNIFISAPSVSQYAALRAFDDTEEVADMREIYKKRRDFMLPRLRDLGFRIPIDPEGAFYIYAGIEKWGIDSMKFVDRALTEAKVAITPGYDFGAFKAGSHIRFSYANSMERLETGCDRLESWLKMV